MQLSAEATHIRRGLALSTRSPTTADASSDSLGEEQTVQIMFVDHVSDLTV